MQRAPWLPLGAAVFLLGGIWAQEPDCIPCHASVQRLPDSRARAAALQSSHLEVSPCESCHAGHAGLQDPTQTGWAPPDLDAASRLCASCHTAHTDSGHPVGGNVQCMTCHVPHVSASADLLRWRPGGMAAACCTCHDVC